MSIYSQWHEDQSAGERAMRRNEKRRNLREAIADAAIRLDGARPGVHTEAALLDLKEAVAALRAHDSEAT